MKGSIHVYELYEKYSVPHRRGEASGKHCFLPLFANVIKNTIISSKTHIFVCLSENMHICSVRRHSNIMLRHLYYVGNHVFVQCDDTLASVTTLLLRGQARLCSVQQHSYIMLRHLYYVSRHVSVQYCTLPPCT